MRRTALAAAATFAVTAIAMPQLIGSFAPSADAQSPPASGSGVPVTAGTVATTDVPVFLNAIGTVQAFNMVTIKSRVDGQIVKLAFTEGQDVKAGETLAVVEAMKMENVLRAERDGTVKKIHAKPGDSLAVDAAIMEFA